MSFPFFDTPPRQAPQATASTSLSPQPARLSPGSMFSFSPPPARSPPAAHSNKEQHRHSAAVERALGQLRTLSAQTKGKGRGKEGIIKNLEQEGWVYVTSTDGIRIFSKESDADEARSGGGALGGRGGAAEREGTFITAPTGAPGNGGGTLLNRGRSNRLRGARRDEDLPWFRGEGFVEGSWGLEDVAQTLTSVGARSVWDPRFDPFRSGVVALLSAKENLWQMHIRAELGADRDACLVSAIEHDEEGVCFVASTSVEDPLIPVHGTRTTIHLNGYCLRALPRSPYFEAPPGKTSSNSEDAPPPTRPGHRRTKSSMSFKNGGGGPLSPSYTAPPLPAIADSGFPFQPRTPGGAGPFSPPSGAGAVLAPLASPRGADTEDGDADSEMMNPFDTLPPQFATLPPKPKPAPMLDPIAPSSRPGLHVSLIVHVSPGFNLPQTTVNQLSLHLPLSIAAINRYLLVYGFSPYLERRPKDEGLDVMSETFDAMAAHYRVVFRRTKEGPWETRIRFYGSGFAKGRFDVEVEGGVEGWWLEYDVQPEGKPEVKRRYDGEDAEKEDVATTSGDRLDPSRPELRPRSKSRKSSLSVLASPTLGGASLRPRTSFTSSLGESIRSGGDPLPNPKLPRASASSSLEPLDPARLPGPLGGCTLFIPNSTSTLHHPISVTITKNSSTVARPLDRLKSMSSALGRAARAGEGRSVQYDTVEEMLERSSGDGQAEMWLSGAREVLGELGRARREEKEMEEGVEEVARGLARGQKGKEVAFVASPAGMGNEELAGGDGAEGKRARRRSSVSISTGLGLEGIDEGET